LLIPTIVGITLITFIVTYLIPGDPALNLVGENASPEIIKQVRKDLGLDRNIMVQYLFYFSRLIRGDFGKSIYSKKSVLKELMSRSICTLQLTLFAMLISVSFGIGSGIINAYFENSYISKLLSGITLLFISTPVFFMAFILMYVFAFKFKLLPASSFVNNNIKYLILPALTLGLRSGAYLSRIVKVNMLNALKQDYVLYARARGISKISIVFKHALKNALIPVVTVIGLDFSSYLNGSVITETIFNLPGIGSYAVNAIYARDYPVICGVVIFGAFIFTLVNLFIDILYCYLDPRITLKGY